MKSASKKSISFSVNLFIPTRLGNASLKTEIIISGYGRWWPGYNYVVAAYHEKLPIFDIRWRVCCVQEHLKWNFLKLKQLNPKLISIKIIMPLDITIIILVHLASLEQLEQLILNFFYNFWSV